MLRAACLIAFWGIRLLLGMRGVPPLALLLADFGIMGAYVWATMPLRRKLGKGFGLAPSWTKLLEGVLGLAVLLAVFDLVHSLR